MKKKEKKIQKKTKKNKLKKKKFNKNCKILKRKNKIELMN